jgi:hypothetical protein
MRLSTMSLSPIAESLASVWQLKDVLQNRTRRFDLPVNKECHQPGAGFPMRALCGSVLAQIACLVVLVFGGLQKAQAQTFQHPGVLLSKAQLDYMKIMVNAHVEPFYRH